MEMYGEEILRLTGLERVNRHDDLADEYSIRADPRAMSGIIVFGRFGDNWTANPGLRPVVRELCARLELLLDRCEHGIVEGNYCDTCNRLYKQAANDPGNQ